MIAETRKKYYNKKYIRSIIKKELKNLKYNSEYIGTKYLIDAIYLLYSSKKYYKFNLEGDVYSVLADKYEDNAGTIKGAIVYSTDKMFYDCDENFLYEYLSNENEFLEDEELDFKPGPKTIIRAVLKRIKDL